MNELNGTASGGNKIVGRLENETKSLIGKLSRLPSGSGGDGDYESLLNKPKINGEVLLGDKSLEDLGELTLTNTEIKQIVDAQFNVIFGGN